MSRCRLCKGFGLVSIPKIAKQCNCSSKHKCYLCENVWKLGLYTECLECLGSGSLIQKNLPINSADKHRSSQSS